MTGVQTCALPILTEAAGLKEQIVVSKRYWGKPWSFTYIKYWLLYLLFGGAVGILSLEFLNRAERYFYAKKYLKFFGNFALSFVIFPPIIFRRVVIARLKKLIKLNKMRQIFI